MNLSEIQSKINAKSLGERPHSLANSQLLDMLFSDKRRTLSEMEYKNINKDKKSHHNNKYE